ncbi:MAG: hypothetical protein MK135_13735 [Polyangiaceae bacterium]|nr:hypothetical protein [Polyangiaceae bacterium]
MKLNLKKFAMALMGVTALILSACDEPGETERAADDESSAGQYRATCSRETAGSIYTRCEDARRSCDEGTEKAECGACLEGYVEVEGQCEETTFCQALECAELGRICPADESENSSCGECHSGRIEIEGACVAPTCKPNQPGSVRNTCAEQGRACEIIKGIAECTDCLAEFVESEGECRAATCAELACHLAGQICIDETETESAYCEPCEAGQTLGENGECRPVIECPADENGMIGLNCVLSNRVCRPGDESSDATCDACIAGYVEEAGQCRPVYDCSTIAADCTAQGLGCTEGDPIEDAICEGCASGLVKDSGECRPAYTCFEGFDQQTPIVPSGQLDCGRVNRECNGENALIDAFCEDCSAGFIEENGSCRPVKDCDCIGDEVCTEPTNNTDGICRECAANEVKLIDECVDCAANLADVSLLNEAACTNAFALATYADEDEDGFGSTQGEFLCQCTEVEPGFVSRGNDCNDSKSLNQNGDFKYSGEDQAPEKTELCDGYDNDCDGVIDEGCPKSFSFSSNAAYDSDKLRSASSTDFSESVDCGAGKIMLGFNKWGYTSGWVGGYQCFNSYVTGLQPSCVDIGSVFKETASTEYNYKITQPTSGGVSNPGILGGRADSWNTIFRGCTNGRSSVTYKNFCQGTRVMVGVKGTTYSSFQPICSSISFTSNSLITAIEVDNTNQVTCPSGEVVVGIKSDFINGGNYSSPSIHNIQLRCQKLTLETISE